jgi:hypothetical protein
MNVAQKTARIAELAMQVSADANKSSALSKSSQRTLEKIIKWASLGYFEITLKCSANNAADMKALGFNVCIILSSGLYKFSLSL